MSPGDAVRAHARKYTSVRKRRVRKYLSSSDGTTCRSHRSCQYHHTYCNRRAAICSDCPHIRSAGCCRHRQWHVHPVSSFQSPYRSRCDHRTFRERAERHHGVHGVASVVAASARDDVFSPVILLEPVTFFSVWQWSRDDVPHSPAPVASLHRRELVPHAARAPISWKVIIDRKRGETTFSSTSCWLSNSSRRSSVSRHSF